MVSDTVAHTTTVEPTRYKKARALLPRLPLCYYYYTAVELCWVSRTTTNRLLPATLLQAQKKWQGPGVRTGSASHSCGLFFVFNTRINSTSLLTTAVVHTNNTAVRSSNICSVLRLLVRLFPKQEAPGLSYHTLTTADRSRQHAIRNTTIHTTHSYKGV